MKAEYLFYIAFIGFIYVYFISMDKVLDGLSVSLDRFQSTSTHIDRVEKKVDAVGDDVAEIKDILKKEWLWRKRT